MKNIVLYITLLGMATSTTTQTQPSVFQSDKYNFNILDFSDKSEPYANNQECFTQESIKHALNLVACSATAFITARILENLYTGMLTKAQKAQQDLLDAQYAMYKKMMEEQQQGNGFDSYTNSEDTDTEQNKTEWFGPLPKEAQQIFNFIKNRPLFDAAGVEGSAHVLLKGIPGTGKSHLARYIAQEINVKFFEANAGEFHNTYIGAGPANMRKLFKQAREAAADTEGIGAIVFIDEIEGIAKSRNALGGGGCESEEIRLLNTLLSEMTRPENKNVLVICATNCPNMLDKAVTRTGRFGLHVTMEPPAYENRVELFRAFLTSAYKKGHDESTTAPYSESLYKRAAQESNGFVTSDVKEAVRRALILAVENRGSTTLTEEELFTTIKEIYKQKISQNTSYLT